MKKKIISILVVFGIIICAISSISTQAGTGKLYTNLTESNLDGIGYGVGNPNNKGKNIWHMSTYDSTKGELSQVQKNIYCLKADYGESWKDFNNSSPIIEYNLVFDLQEDREDLSSKIVDNNNDADEVLQALLNKNGTQYRQVLWLVDNMYIEGQTNKDEYLSRAGIEKDVYEGGVEYYNSKTDKIYGEEALTEADIIAIQRVAIWTFTNGGDYDKTESAHWLRVTSDETNYSILSDSRDAMAVDLYNYLVSSAKTGANLYTEENNYTINECPVKVNLNGLIQENNKYQIVSEISDSNYIIGPIKLEKINNFAYDISLTLKDANGSIINSSKYSFTDANGNSLGNVTLKDLIGKKEGFYIKLDNSFGTEYNVEINVKHYNTNKNLWLQGTETSDKVLLNAEQMLVEFSTEEEITKIDFSVGIEEIETTEIYVQKKWDDNNNQDGIRPDLIRVKLLADGIAVDGKMLQLTEENDWSGKFSELPLGSNNEVTHYTVEEITQIDGYEKPMITGNSDSGFVITNMHIPDVTQISVEKVWDDNDNQDGIRPESITVKLLSNGIQIATQQVELDESNNWKHTFTNLPVYSNGTKINYTVSELILPEGYASQVEGNMEDGFVITNTHIPEQTQISVQKVWNDNQNQDGNRPKTVNVNLLANGNVIEEKTVELSDENGWEYVFENLPAYSNGTKIQYAVEEKNVEVGYISQVMGNEQTGFTIVNTYSYPKVKIPIRKLWVDSSDQKGERPDSIELCILANGVEVGKEIVSGDGNEWSFTLNEYPKYKDGEEIEYTVIEEIVLEKYAPLTIGNPLNSFTIKNVYSPKKTSIKIMKIWEDNENQDGIRPDSVTVNLFANEELIRTIELNESNSWQYMIENLPQEMNEQEIIYTIEETSEIEGYTSKITGDAKNGFVITNTHEVGLRNIKVTKKWEDDNNFDETRPESITVKLLGDKTEIEEIVLNEENKWTYIFENLPENKDGKEILYEVVETPVPEGYAVDISGSMEEGYILTNKHIVNKIFDLALRKYIVKINNNELHTLGLPTRVPNILLESLKNGTTATYKHRKDPVEVEENDIVTYAITIYNEGEKSGYATQIIDQLPTGLIFNPSTTIISKDSNGLDKNKYKVTYESSTNKVIFDIINTEEEPAKALKPYKNEVIDSETIEIKCKVIYKAKAGKNTILTNVAWINEAFDLDANKPIITIGDDRDSEPGTKPNVNKDQIEDYKGKETNKDDLTDSLNYYEGKQDDDDFEKIYVKTFDLSLRKFIDTVNGEKLENSREPIVDVTPLKNKESTTAIYTHSKIPIGLKVGDTIIYTIRIYNEGEIDGYASEVKDYLPPYLEFVENSEVNKKYGWNISKDGRLATTKYLLDKEIKAFNGTTLDYEDLQIECKISENAIQKEKITNIAEISEYKYGNNIHPEDVDSESQNIDENMPIDESLPEYKEEQEYDKYVPGNEDDDDFEKVYVKEFDLALRKFITQIQDKQITTREPQIKSENGVLKYEQPKDALIVHVGDIIIYTLRIYNEGEAAGYASEVTDHIPEYLEYLPENSTNLEYMWKMYDENGNKTENIEKAVKVKTSYLSKENGEHNLIEAYDGNTLYYRDLKIAFKVKDPNSNTCLITNKAQISNDTDDAGNKTNDNDSITEQWNEGEDDQDIESIKVQYFDLSILKFVSKVIVIENGKETITETGYNGHENPEPVVKVELHKKKLNNVVVKFGYGITVTNEGDTPGYATEITDYVPKGLKFIADDNPNWIDEGNNIISTKQLENTLLQPGESKTIEVILTWINGPDNLAQKTNIVEISDDKNEYDILDKDSITDNKNEAEDDIDEAIVMLAISTGRTQTYFILTLGLLAVVLIGVILIKKFVI